MSGAAMQQVSQKQTVTQGHQQDIDLNSGSGMEPEPDNVPKDLDQSSAETDVMAALEQDPPSSEPDKSKDTAAAAPAAAPAPSPLEVLSGEVAGLEAHHRILTELKKQSDELRTALEKRVNPDKQAKVLEAEEKQLTGKERKLDTEAITGRKQERKEAHADKFEERVTRQIDNTHEQIKRDWDTLQRERQDFIAKMDRELPEAQRRPSELLDKINATLARNNNPLNNAAIQDGLRNSVVPRAKPATAPTEAELQTKKTQLEAGIAAITAGIESDIMRCAAVYPGSEQRVRGIIELHARVIGKSQAEKDRMMPAVLDEKGMHARLRELDTARYAAKNTIDNEHIALMTAAEQWERYKKGADR